MKTCTRCRETKPLDQFHKRARSKDGLTSRCGPCRSQEVREYRVKYPEKVIEYGRTSNLRKAFGITVAEYEALLAEQSGGCGICGKTCTTGRRLAVDHDHETGRVRGLLCSRCNRGIGLFFDSAEHLRKAADYVG